MRKAEPKRGAVIYARVSTKEQIDNLSLETQVRDCRAYCATNGLTVEKIFLEEGESAKTANRTQLNAMIEYCSAKRSSIHAVVVWRVDRFSRNAEVH